MSKQIISTKILTSRTELMVFGGEMGIGDQQSVAPPGG